MKKEELKYVKELYFKICGFRYKNEEDFKKFCNYNVSNYLLYEWEASERKEKYDEIYECLSRYKGGLDDTHNILTIFHYDIHRYEFQFFWEIKEYLDLINEMDKKGVWEFIFNIGLVDFRESRLPDRLYIRRYFLCDSKSDYHLLDDKKIYVHTGYSGLLARCNYMLDFQPTIYKDIVDQLIRLLIHGISVGGIQCIDLAMDLYNFINCRLKASELNKTRHYYSKMLKDNYPLPDEAFENSKKIDTMKSYFQTCHNSGVDSVIYNYITKIDIILNEIETNKINSDEASMMLGIESLHSFLRFIDEVSYEYFELYKIYYLVNHTYFFVISYAYDESNRDMYIRFFNSLVDINDKNNKFYIYGKEYCGLIPYCYYMGYKYICFLLITGALELINICKGYKKEIDLFEKFYNLLISFANEIGNNDFMNILKNNKHYTR